MKLTHERTLFYFLFHCPYVRAKIIFISQPLYMGNIFFIFTKKNREEDG